MGSWGDEPLAGDALATALTQRALDGLTFRTGAHQRKEGTLPRTRQVVILVFDGMKMLDVSGPAELFSEANRFGARYRLR